jgi:hypothetical protein
MCITLEITCGKCVYNKIVPNSQVLIDYIWQQHQNNTLLNVVDSSLEKDFIDE